jgi:hypothetical protein
MTSNRFERSTLVGLALLALSAGAAHAQTSIGMGYGGYFPMGGSLIREYGGVGGGPVPYPIFEKWQTGAVTLSARITRQITSRLSIQAKLLHSPGRVSTRDSLNEVLEQSAYMSIVSLRAPLQLTSAGSGIVFQISPGIGFAKRGGKAWQGVGGTSNPTAVLAIAFGGQLGRRSRWSSKVEIEDYFSSVQYDYAHWNPTVRRFHHDFMLMVGVDYSFRKPRSINRPRRPQ